jgi:putative copper export protein
MTVWSLVRFLHVLGAVGWVGGQLALSAVVVPVVRRQVGSPADRAALMRDSGKRFALLANAILLPTLLATGVALAVHRRIDVTDLGSSTYGILFGTKLAFVVASIALAGAHGITVRRAPRLGRPLAIAGLIASVSIVLFATALVA